MNLVFLVDFKNSKIGTDFTLSSKLSVLGHSVFLAKSVDEINYAESSADVIILGNSVEDNSINSSKKYIDAKLYSNFQDLVANLK